MSEIPHPEGAPENTPDAVTDPEVDEVLADETDPDETARSATEEGTAQDPASFLDP
ncbi:MAG TPA: hypothetical protein VGC57_03755 [Cellulomonas sp.]